MGEPDIVILPPDGGEHPFERRVGAATFRPYTPRDGHPPGSEAPPRLDRRRRRRPKVDALRGQRLDIEG